MEGVVEGDIVEEHAIVNPKSLNDHEKDGEVEDLGFIGKIGMIPPPRIVSSGVGVIRWSCIEIVKGVGLFNGKVLR